MYVLNFHHYESLNALGIQWAHCEAGEGGETDNWIEINDDSKKWLDDNFSGWEEN